MIELISKKQNEKRVVQKRCEIYGLLIQQSKNIKSGIIKSISTSDMKLLYELYDMVFFGNWFKDNFKGELRFSLSRRMTKSAGMTLCPKNIGKVKQEEIVIEIRMGVDFFFQYDLVEGSKTVCGIKTENSLHALQLVFEHELCHVIEFILFNFSSCSGERFGSIANNVFGHTESSHKLPTHKWIASEKLGLHIGDAVTFTFEGIKMNGIIYAINKRATVMVKNPNGVLADKNGNRYSKYYIPLNMLESAVN